MRYSLLLILTKLILKFVFKVLTKLWFSAIYQTECTVSDNKKLLAQSLHPQFRILQARWTSCCPMNNVTAMKGKQSTETIIHWPLPFSSTNDPVEGMSYHLYQSQKSWPKHEMQQYDNVFISTSNNYLNKRIWCISQNGMNQSINNWNYLRKRHCHCSAMQTRTVITRMYFTFNSLSHLLSPQWLLLLILILLGCIACMQCTDMAYCYRCHT